MLLRRSHVARLAVVSLVGLGLMGLSGAANADKPHADRAPSAKPSGNRLCLPRTPANDLHLPVNLPTCLPDPSAQDPSGGSSGTPSHDTAKPSRHATAKADPGDPGSQPICVPLPADLLRQLPKAIPTCLPKCLSDAVLRDLQKLPQDTLNELLGDITQTLGELPECLTSLLPQPAPTNPPEQPSPSPTHSHGHEPSANPTISTHVPSTAGPATPIPGRPDFTG